MSGPVRIPALQGQEEANSVHLPGLLSFEDWDALPEDHSAHIELQEGVLIVSPRPLRPQARATFQIAKQR